MATNFSANQYENGFIAHRLLNYEIPDTHKERPSSRKGATKIITNDRGHLKSSLRRSTEDPWGTFKGTWNMDCKNTRHAGTLVQPTKTPSVFIKSEKTIAALIEKNVEDSEKVDELEKVVESE